MCFHCKQVCMKRERKKMTVIVFHWKGWGNLQQRHCHLQEVEKSSWTTRAKAFPLGNGSCRPDGHLWADIAGNLSMACDEKEKQIQKQNLLSFGKYCLSLLREFTSSVTAVKVILNMKMSLLFLILKQQQQKKTCGFPVVLLFLALNQVMSCLQ